MHKEEKEHLEKLFSCAKCKGLFYHGTDTFCNDIVLHLTGYLEFVTGKIICVLHRTSFLDRIRKNCAPLLRYLVNLE